MICLKNVNEIRLAANGPQQLAIYMTHKFLTEIFGAGDSASESRLASCSVFQQTDSVRRIQNENNYLQSIVGGSALSGLDESTKNSQGFTWRAKGDSQKT